MEDQELTSTLIHALENSQQGFDEFKTMFSNCASAFELGKDAEGIEILTAVLQPLNDFSNFCANISSTHALLIPEELLIDFTKQCETFKTLVEELLTEMEDKNYIEVGDILKYDLGDLICAMSVSFPKIAEALKSTADITY